MTFKYIIVGLLTLIAVPAHAVLRDISADVIRNATTQNATLNIPLTSTSANTAAIWNASDTLASSPTTAAQLGFLSTTTSDVQTQLNGKQNAVTFSDSIQDVGGVVSLVGDVGTPTASTYYGTNASSVLGYYAFPAAGVSSVSNADGTLTISPTTGNVVASLALGHINTWTATQNFAGLTATSVTDSGLSANDAVATGAGGLLISSSTSSAQLAFLNSVTSNVQTQLNGKQSTLTFIDSLVDTGGNVSLVGDTATPTASTYYGTNASSVLGYYPIAASAVTSVSNSDGSLTISPTTGAVVASLNPAHSNTFSATQNFAGTTATSVTDSGLTPSTAVFAGAGGILSSSTTTSTQLGFLSTTTSDVQTQLNGKEGTLIFADSIVDTAGTVTLVGDTPTPTASTYYGTNASSVLGYYALPVSSGANVFLSNLSSPTAINQDLLPASDSTFNLGSATDFWLEVFTDQVRTPLITYSTDINVETDNESAGNSGAVNLTTGSLTGTPRPGGLSGNIALTTGDSSSGTAITPGATGDVDLTTGSATRDSNSGNLNFTTGNTDGTSAGLVSGTIALVTGAVLNSSGNYTKTSGAVSIATGNTGTSPNDIVGSTSGPVTITTGSTTSDNIASGAINLETGANTATLGAGSTSGDINITTGPSSSSAGTTGNIYLTIGTAASNTVVAGEIGLIDQFASIAITPDQYNDPAITLTSVDTTDTAAPLVITASVVNLGDLSDNPINITNVKDPVNPFDAANMEYVDNTTQALLLIQGTESAPVLVTGASTITPSTNTRASGFSDTDIYVAGSGAPVTLASANFTPCTVDGLRLTLIGESNTNTVTITAGGTGPNLIMNGNDVLRAGSTLTLRCTTGGNYQEVSRNDL